MRAIRSTRPGGHIIVTGEYSKAAKIAKASGGTRD